MTHKLSLHVEMEAAREKVKTGEWKLRKYTNRKSKVWETFAEIMKDDDQSAGFVMCTSCDAIYTFDSHKTGTTNMARHKCGPGNPSQPNRAASGQPRPQTIDAFMRPDHMKIPLQVKSKFVDYCVDFCCTDLRPFDIVSGEGFTKVAQGLINIGARYGSVDANGVLPHRQTVCDRAKKQAMVEKEALSEVLKSAVHDNGGVAITTDMWTDDFNRRSYTVLTCHYITEDWKLASRVMCTVEFDCTLPKTAINIHEQINEQLCSYGISFDQVVLLSDQGSNIKAALKNYHWIPCAAHVLNTILKHTFSGSDIEEVTKMIDACKGIVKYLKKASASTALPHGLVQDCETRWNSKIDMLKSVSKQYRKINELLESRGQSERMEGIYQNTLTTVIDSLEPFKKASEELQGEDYPTLHLVMLWFYNLRAHCQPVFGDPEYMALLRTRTLALLHEKLILTDTHKIALFLCPRYKSLKMMTETERKNLHRIIGNLIYPVSFEAADSPETSSTTAPWTSTGEDVTNESQREKRPRVDFAEWAADAADVGLTNELKRYLAAHFTLDDCDEDRLLEFWERQAPTFPRLRALARRILCVPASSAATLCSVSECVQHQYHFINERKNWTEAQRYCRENYTDLATVDNMNELNKCVNNRSVQFVWIGLQKTGRYKWQWSSGEPALYLNWATGQPEGRDDCDKLILIKENLTWSEALSYCRQNHVDLVSVHSEEIQRRVMNVVKRASTAAVWLGLHNYCSMNMWLWVSVEIVCYHNWAPGNGMTRENCKFEKRKGAVQSGGDQRWISLPESHKLNFIFRKKE
ncbi:macrophage mannose receptor 1-like protein [Labeo rohita]|uniref:Macrophage mannose receptor 1-like protein n=1 Tax=Labeo rohita TaxID=84645 RepID=A0A498MFA3_LABRO|nr:macrophage mannose receptor 1-like protein [Labeo rohita]